MGRYPISDIVSYERQYPHAVIERQLAHGERNKVSASYNFAEYLPERRKMTQECANHLDTLKATSTLSA